MRPDEEGHVFQRFARDTKIHYSEGPEWRYNFLKRRRFIKPTGSRGLPYFGKLIHKMGAVESN